jgi:TPR repeat protein
MSDDREAARLYKLAADQGNAGGQANLGLLYEEGRGGLPENDREAARLFKLAADQGDARAQDALTRCSLRQQQEEQERQREATVREWRRRQEEAAAKERQRQQQEEQERQREAAARERQRRQEEKGPRRDAASGNMSAAQALEILGINAGATEQDIRAAYNRLMKRVHPDVGGSTYFSKQLNAARDVLLG